MTLPLNDLIYELAAPPNRRGKHTGEFEHHFYEGAVMVAYAMHLLRTEATREVLRVSQHHHPVPHSHTSRSIVMRKPKNICPFLCNPIIPHK